jgi:hypothetical protein
MMTAILMVCLLTGSAARAQTGQPEQKPVRAQQPVEQKAAGGFRLFKDGAGFMVLEGRLLIELIVIRNDIVEPGIFFLDVGAAGACAFEDCFTDKLGVGEKEAVSIKVGQDISIDGVVPRRVDTEEYRLFARRNAAVLQGRPVCGLLGYGLFSGRMAELDFSEYRLRLVSVKSGGKGPEGGANTSAAKTNGIPVWEIPYRMRPAPLTCDVAINGTEGFVFRISTACSPSWVRKEKASSARWRKGRKPDSLRVAGVEVGTVPLEFDFVNSADPREPSLFPDGMLGNDFLSYFSVTLDTTRQIMQLRPVQPAQGK